jgi:CheY-like chemotaxis protein
MTRLRPIEILLAEDSPGDAKLTAMALERGRVNNNLHVVGDGEQAMDFLCRRGVYRDRPRPDLILLDLNMPRMDGREVLQAVKADDELKKIPIVVLTTSDAEWDILKSYELHANAYITKPVDVGRFIDVVQQIEDFWLTIVKLPPANGALAA